MSAPKRHPYVADGDKNRCATCQWPAGAVFHVEEGDEPVYINRWQFDSVWPELCKCDECGRKVAPVSTGWAHVFDSAGALAAHDFSQTEHKATVLGHAA